MVAHLVVEWNGNVRRLSSADVENSRSEVLSWISSSLVVVSFLNEVLSPIVEILGIFDSCIL